MLYSPFELHAPAFARHLHSLLAAGYLFASGFGTIAIYKVGSFWALWSIKKSSPQEGACGL